MTREEVKERIEIIAHNESTTWDSHILIDEIYEEFEEIEAEYKKVINELQSRLSSILKIVVGESK